MSREPFTPKAGDRDKLNAQQRILLEGEILPTAKRWLHDFADHPTLQDAALSTLQYWSETIPEYPKGSNR